MAKAPGELDIELRRHHIERTRSQRVRLSIPLKHLHARGAVPKPLAAESRPVMLRGRSAATRLSALARSHGRCERCQKNPAVQVPHKDRMKAKRSILAKVASDRDQQNQARALCKECHLEDQHGTGQG
jgi:hypothetical protein